MLCYVMYKFKIIVGKHNFSDQFEKIIKHYIKAGYNLDDMRKSTCLVLNSITVYSYGFILNYTTMGQASASGRILVLHSDNHITSGRQPK